MKLRSIGAILIGCGLLTGCAAVALTALGVGASTGVSHSLNGMTYRTFTEPLPRVRSASMRALQRMQIKVASSEKIEGGEGIKAMSGDRAIDIELESVSPSTTRMRVTAKKNLFLYDNATATEIILQTEKYL
ncbi:MAG: DUF3568 family protein [Pseudomonadota bacterium]